MNKGNPADHSKYNTNKRIKSIYKIKEAALLLEFNKIECHDIISSTHVINFVEGNLIELTWKIKYLIDLKHWNG